MFENTSTIHSWTVSKLKTETRYSCTVVEAILLLLNTTVLLKKVKEKSQNLCEKFWQQPRLLANSGFDIES